MTRVSTAGRAGPTGAAAPGRGAGAPARTTGALGVVVFLASDVMLFAPFFAAYHLLRVTNSPWPPEGVELDVPRAAVATAVLLVSSVTMVLGDRAHHRGDGAASRRWLLATIGLGAAFLVNQVLEYATLSFGPTDHPYGSSYFGLTLLHSAHVTAGVAAIGLVWVRSARTAALDEVTPWLSGTSMFWHLVDVVWVAVFLTIWVIQ